MEEKMNPALRCEWEELPIQIKNKILEAGILPQTSRELHEAAARFQGITQPEVEG